MWHKPAGSKTSKEWVGQKNNNRKDPVRIQLSFIRKEGEVRDQGFASFHFANATRKQRCAHRVPNERRCVQPTFQLLQYGNPSFTKQLWSTWMEGRAERAHSCSSKMGIFHMRALKITQWDCIRFRRLESSVILYLK